MKIRKKFGFNHFSRAIAFLIALVSFAAPSVFAQTTTGTIRGTVTGSNGAPIPSAQIVARNVTTHGFTMALRMSSALLPVLSAFSTCLLPGP